jgi:hypothetical protein
VCFRARSAPEGWDVEEVLLDVGEPPPSAVVIESGGLAGSWMRSANGEGRVDEPAGAAGPDVGNCWLVAVSKVACAASLPGDVESTVREACR